VRRLARNVTAAAVPSREMAVLSTLKASVDALKLELSSSLKKTQETIDEMKAAMCGQSVILECLESAVTASAELMRELEERLEGNWGAARVPPPPPDSGRGVVDAMMTQTIILDCSQAKLNRARCIYERLSTDNEFTKCLCEIWRNHHDAIAVKIDFDQGSIARMKSKFLDHDGVERDGKYCRSFADFSNCVLYVAGSHSEEDNLGYLASGLAQVCFFLAFGNGGRPYVRGDRVSKRELAAAIEEAEEKGGSGVYLDWSILLALEKRTHLAREICVTSAVPWIVAFYGRIEGTSDLRAQVPLLLEFYERRVLPALREKAGVRLH
jgi:hypothetical protein